MFPAALARPLEMLLVDHPGDARLAIAALSDGRARNRITVPTDSERALPRPKAQPSCGAEVPRIPSVAALHAGRAVRSTLSRCAAPEAR
jgi:hypothetical protein